MTEAQGDAVLVVLDQIADSLARLDDLSAAISQAATLIAVWAWFSFGWYMMRHILGKYSVAAKRFGERV